MFNHEFTQKKDIPISMSCKCICLRICCLLTFICPGVLRAALSTRSVLGVSGLDVRGVPGVPAAPGVVGARPGVSFRLGRPGVF